MLAPDIYRQRFLIEGYYTIDVDKDVVADYLTSLPKELDLRVYGDPIIFSPSIGVGKPENAGYDAFIPLIDSGISLYIWSAAKFLSTVIYTCKGFDENKALAFTKEFYKITGETDTKSF